jgi:multisubunit Na+/H+ antiporter MnhF subunit
MASSQHPAATPHLPGFITAPGQTDVLMVIMAVILLLAILGFGILFFRLHSLPERIAHKSQRLQFEIVAVLGLISLFTHMHIFWVIGLLLALIEFPDFGTPLGRIARSTEKIAGLEPQPASTIAPLVPHEEASERDLAPSPAASLSDSGKTDQRENGVSPAAVPARPREVDHA